MWHVSAGPAVSAAVQGEHGHVCGLLRTVCSVGGGQPAVVSVSAQASDFFIDVSDKEEETDKHRALNTRGECGVFHFLYIC